MAGYSTRPLAAKLGVKPNGLVLIDFAPGVAGAELDLGFLAGVRHLQWLPTSGAGVDTLLTFHTHTATLTRRLPRLFERTAVAGQVRVCWPKQTALKALGLDSDLDGSVVRSAGLRAGFVDVKVAAIDTTWSGLKFVRRLSDR